MKLPKESGVEPATVRTEPVQISGIGVDGADVDHGKDYSMKPRTESKSLLFKEIKAAYKATLDQCEQQDSLDAELAKRRVNAQTKAFASAKESDKITIRTPTSKDHGFYGKAKVQTVPYRLDLLPGEFTVRSFAASEGITIDAADKRIKRAYEKRMFDRSLMKVYDADGNPTRTYVYTLSDSEIADREKERAYRTKIAEAGTRRVEGLVEVSPGVKRSVTYVRRESEVESKGRGGSMVDR